MEKEGGVYTIPCTVNGIKLKFIFDTGASNVSMSLTEARFLLKNGYLKKEDILSETKIQDATGNISAGTIINIREFEFSGLILNDVKATIVHELSAPLLLGQTAMAKLGKFQFDPNNGTLTIMNDSSNTIINSDDADLTETENNKENIKNIFTPYSPEDYRRLIQECTERLTINSRDINAYLDRGNSKSHLEDYKGAIADYTKAIEIDLNNDDAYEGRGIAKANLKDFKGAIADYTKAIELIPNSVSAYIHRGNSKSNLEDYQGALADYTKAIKIDPKNGYAYNDRGNSKYNEKDFKGAIEDYNKAIEINPENENTYYPRGMAKFYLQDYQGAIEDYDKVIIFKELNGGWCNINLEIEQCTLTLTPDVNLIFTSDK